MVNLKNPGRSFRMKFKDFSCVLLMQKILNPDDGCYKDVQVFYLLSYRVARAVETSARPV